MRAWEPLLFSRQLQLCWTQFKWPFCMLGDNTIEIRERICLHHEIIPLLFKVQLNSQSHHIVFSQNFSIYPWSNWKVQIILIQFAEYLTLRKEFVVSSIFHIHLWEKLSVGSNVMLMSRIKLIFVVFYLLMLWASRYLEVCSHFSNVEHFCLGTCMSQCHFVFHFNGPAIEHFCN